jgi:WD40 repeat protein
MPDAWDRVADALTDFEYLQAKISASSHHGEPPADVFALLDDFVEAIEAMPPGHKGRAELQRLCRAIDGNSHVLTQMPRLLVQQVYNAWRWGDESLEKKVTAAERALPCPRLRLLNRPGEPPPCIRTMFGHADHVTSVTHTRDGACVFSVSRDRTLLGWDARTGQQLLRLEGVSCVAFSPDGTGCVTANYRILKVWETGTWRRKFTLGGHEHGVTALAVGPHCLRIVSGDTYGTMKLWHGREGQEIVTWQGHEGKVTSLAFSPDGSHFASTGDETMRVWYADTLDCLFHCKWQSGTPCGVAFSPDSTRITSGSSTRLFQVWDVRTAQVLFTLDGHTAPINAVAFSPDGRWIASGSDDRTVRIWDVGTGRQLLALSGHTEAVMAVAFSPDGSSLVSGSDDRTLMVWATGLDRSLESPRALAPEWPCFAGERKGVVAVIRDEDDSLEFKEDSTSGDTASSFFDVLRNRLALSPDGSALASVERPIFEVRDVPTGRVVISVPNRDSHDVLAFSPDGSKVVSDVGGSLMGWDVRTGQELPSFGSHKGDVTAVAFSPDCTHVASGGSDGAVKVWCFDTGRESLALPEPHRGQVATLAFSPDGSRLASGSWDETLNVWELTRSLKPLALAAHLGVVTVVAWGPDRVTLAAGGSDRTLKSWNVETRQELCRFEGHGDVVLAAAFSPDGSLLASSSADRTLKVWDATTGRELATFPCSERIRSIWFHPGGRILHVAVRDRSTDVPAVHVLELVLPTDDPAAKE